MSRKVVVTGYGAVSPLGCSIDKIWSNILAGKSGITKVNDLQVDQLRSTIAGRVSGYDADKHFTAKEQRKYDPFIQYAICAADQAIAHAGIDLQNENLDNIGVAIGSGIGGLACIEENTRTMITSNAKRISPFFIPATIINMASGIISIKYGLKGPNISVVTACTTGSHNIGLASRMISYGDAEVMVVGGAEYGSVMLGLGGFAALRALSTRNSEPTKASRPWDRDRDGFVLSDGAGVMVIESLEHARARGADILAEISGFGMSADGHHMTQPDLSGKGAVRSMKNALIDAKATMDLFLRSRNYLKKTIRKGYEL